MKNNIYVQITSFTLFAYIIDVQYGINVNFPRRWRIAIW